MNKITSFFTEHLAWKILALLLAITFWFVSMNIENPTITQTVILPLQLSNKELLGTNSKILQNQNSLQSTSITVTVRGKASELRDLSTKLKAYVDLGLFEVLNSNQTGMPLSATVEVDNLRNYNFDILDRSPKTVDVIVDRFITTSRTINAKFNDTKVAEGYAFTNPTITPETVQISGAQSTLGKINSIAVSVDLNNATQDVKVNSALHAYDVDGKEIFDVEMTPKYAVVQVPVSKIAKIPVEKPITFGVPKAGYVVTSVTYNPSFIEVMGSEEEVLNLKSIMLKSIDVTGLDKPITHSYDLREYLLKTSLSIVNGTAQEVTATVNIEKLGQKEIVLPTSDILKTGYTTGANIKTQELVLHIEGPESLLSTIETISATMSLANLHEGENQVEVAFFLPEGIVLVGTPPIVNVFVQSIDAHENDPQTITTP